MEKKLFRETAYYGGEGDGVNSNMFVGEDTFENRLKLVEDSWASGEWLEYDVEDVSREGLEKAHEEGTVDDDAYLFITGAENIIELATYGDYDDPSSVFLKAMTLAEAFEEAAGKFREEVDEFYKLFKEADHE